MRRGMRKAAIAASIVAVVVAVTVSASLGASASNAAANKTSDPSSCQLGNGVKHVVEILFDNTHYNRDNPNVLSDLEQMPALKNFITQNGTLLSNMHTPLIAHTADDSLTGYTGLYGDRHGQPITNSYETYLSNGSVVSHSSFSYWTGTYGVDQFPNQPYSPNVPASGSPPSTPPAPWVPFTRAGCNVGDVSTANMVLENTNPDLAHFFGPNSPEVQQLNADPTRSRIRRRTTISASASIARREPRSAPTPKRSNSVRRRRRPPPSPIPFPTSRAATAASRLSSDRST